MRVLPLFLLIALGIHGPAAEDSPPNVIVIVADDLGYGDLSCYGQKHFQTPELDRMAAEGIRFTDHHAGSTVCLPSRCALLTGRDMGHASLRGNGDASLDPTRERLLPIAFKEAGYDTAMIGKSCVQSNLDASAPARCGFDHFFGYLLHKEAHVHFPDHLWRNGAKVPVEGNRNRLGKVYCEDEFHREAREWISRPREKPFFLLLSLTVPHADLSAPEDAVAEFRGRFQESPFPGNGYVACPEPKATHAAMVALMDREIGRLLALLREKGIDRRTLVMFTSDNGGHSEGGHHYNHFGSNAPFRGGKRDLWDGGIRVPLIVWWPGTVRPGTSGHVSAGWDIFPTLAEVAGLAGPSPTEGLSFAPLLTGRPQAEHDALYWEFHEQGGKQAVRMGKWKAVRLDVSRDPNARPALYDLARDPGESRDVADEFPEVVAEMAKRMANRTTSGRAEWNFPPPKKR